MTTFATDYGLSVVDLARAVEERGLDSIFFNEHTHIPVSRRTAFPGGGELPKEYSHTHDPFVALAAAAAVTKRIVLSTGICLVIERDLVLAKEVASLAGCGKRILEGLDGCGRSAPCIKDGRFPSPLSLLGETRVREQAAEVVFSAAC